MSARLECPETEPHYLTLSPQASELLALLAAGRGRFFDRSAIAESIWGSEGGDRSTGCVHTALWRLRRELEAPPLKRGDLLTANSPGAVGLNGPHPVMLDIAEFEKLTRPGLSKPLEQVGEQDERH